MKNSPKDLKAPDKKAYLQIISIKDETDNDGDIPMAQTNIPSSSQVKGANISSVGINGLNKVVSSIPNHIVINLGCKTTK